MKSLLVFAAAAVIALTTIDLAFLAQKLAETALSDAQARMAGRILTDIVFADLV
jgi:hypothetical protein